MNYNEEMAELFTELGLKNWELQPIAEEDKATPENWADLEERCFLKSEENARVLFLSEIYAQDSLVCQSDGKQYTLNRR